VLLQKDNQKTSLLLYFLAVVGAIGILTSGALFVVTGGDFFALDGI